MLSFQVVKSRIQGATKAPGVVPKYNWTYPALVTIFREEGPTALYKGFAPKVLRLAPGGGVLLLVVEFTLGIFRKGACLVSRYNSTEPYLSIHFSHQLLDLHTSKHWTHVLVCIYIDYHSSFQFSFSHTIRLTFSDSSAVSKHLLMAASSGDHVMSLLHSLSSSSFLVACFVVQKTQLPQSPSAEAFGSILILKWNLHTINIIYRTVHHCIRPIQRIGEYL